jgi:hypothetical protein
LGERKGEGEERRGIGKSWGVVALSLIVEHNSTNLAHRDFAIDT